MRLTVVDKLLWLKVASRDQTTEWNVEGLHDLIESYITRYHHEITDLKEKARPGRPKSSRLVLLENVMKKERAEYIQTGFEIPNLLDVECFHVLRGWNGDYNSLKTITMVRLKAEAAQIEHVVVSDVKMDGTPSDFDMEEEEAVMDGE